MANHLSALPDPHMVRRTFEFTWTDGVGARWQARPELEPGAPAVQRYRGGIWRDDKRVGVFRRKVTASSVDGLSVEHVTLHLNLDAQGRGFASAYWSASLKQYGLLGADRVVLNADADGRTFWARDPVRFVRPDTARDMLAQWELKGGWGSGQAGFLDAAARRKMRSSVIELFVAQVDENPESFTPAGLYRSEVGHLLLEGAPWKGIVDL
jgi:hypothetical protein